MTRSGYLGQQHYGALSWSGDVLIKEIGEIEQTDFTDEDEALQLVDSMSKIADGLAAVAGVDAE